MRVDYRDLINCSSRAKEQYANFFDTFGFIEISNAIPVNLANRLRKIYTQSISESAGASWNRIKRSKNGMHFIPNYQCSNDVFFYDLLIPIIHPLAQLFGGKNPVYLGSDASCFCGYSFNWHRDWFTRIPQLKFNLYLDNDVKLGGDHLVVPGSHHSYDRYCTMLSKGLEWPHKCTSDSGFELNEFFPKIPSPRISALKELSLHLTGRFSSIPYYRIRQNPTSLVLFDQRTVHCVQKPWPNRPQLLVTALFAPDLEDPNWNDKYADTQPNNFSFSSRDYLLELFTLFVGERRMINIPNYGYLDKYFSANDLRYVETFLSEPISTNAQKARLSGETSWLDLEVQLNELSAVGWSRKQFLEPSQNMYTDLMMGVNHRNITR